MRRRARVGGALLLLLLLAAPPLRAQPTGALAPYMGAVVGAHIGIDYLFEGFLAGGQTVLYLDPWGRVQVVPNAELEFRQGLRDWQANADLAVSPFPGVYVGGGLAFRNTIFDEEIGRETRRGYSVFLGFREPPRPRRFSPQIELRWSFIDQLRPRMVTLGINYPIFLFRL